MFNLPPEIGDALPPYLHLEIASCIVRCNEQIMYEQKSWKDLASENRITVITLVACSIIAAMAMPIDKLTAFVSIPMLYLLMKTRSLACKATDTLLESESFFTDIFLKNAELKNVDYNTHADKMLSFESKLLNNMHIPKKELHEIKAIVWNYSTEEDTTQYCLGSLIRVAFLQLIKDYKYACAMERQKKASTMGIYALFFATTTFSCISSKLRIIISAIFSGISLYAAKQSFDTYKMYSNDSKIEERTLRKLLLVLHRKLAVPKELYAY